MRASVLWSVLAGTLFPAHAAAVCRVVEPLDGNGVAFDPETTMIVVQATEQLVAYRCPDTGAGSTVGSDDAGVLDAGPHPTSTPDAGSTDAGVALETTFDGGMKVPPGGSTSFDAGSPSDAGTMRCPGGEDPLPVYDSLVHVLLQPKLYANGGKAGLIMPLPRRADVHAAPAALVEQVREQLEFRVRETVEYVEDRDLGYQCSDPHYSAALDPRWLAAPLALYGCGGEEYYRPGLEDMGTDVADYGSGTMREESSEGDVVRFEEIPVGEDYDATVLNASSMAALTAWLDEHGFAHDAHDDAAFESYVGEGRWFMALEVHPPDRDGERRALAPVVVSYRGTEMPIAHELTYDPVGGLLKTDLFVLAPNRMAVADGDADVRYARPFQLDELDEWVSDGLGGLGLTAGWVTWMSITRRMDELKADTELVPVANEELVETLERRTRIRIAMACCPGQKIPGEGAERTFTERYEYDEAEPPQERDGFYTTPPPEDAYCRVREGSGGSGASSTSGGPACAVAGAVGSWSPLLLALWLTFHRARRRRRSR